MFCGTRSNAPVEVKLAKIFQESKPRMWKIVSPATLSLLFVFLVFDVAASMPLLRSVAPRASQPATAQPQQAAWETYTFPGEEFSVALPEMPALDHSSRRVLGEAQTDTARNYGAYGNGVVYLIRAYDKPRTGEDINYFARYYLRSLIYGDRSIEVRVERELPLGKFSGRQYVIVRDNKPMSVPVSSFYVFLTKQHAYAVRAVGGDDQHPDVQRFFTSFTLADKPAGRQIVDESNLPRPKVKRVATSAPPDKKKQASGEEKSKGTETKTSGGESGEDKDAGGNRVGSEDTQKTNTSPTTDAAEANQTYGQKEVTHKAAIVYKPEPMYTEEARKNQVTGTVRLRLVLAASGKVTDIVAVTILPNGLTEMAARAASHVKFIPAEKDGRKVSQYVTIEYNFNIY
jgi:TonB family protein